MTFNGTAATVDPLERNHDHGGRAHGGDYRHCRGDGGRSSKQWCDVHGQRWQPALSNGYQYRQTVVLGHANVPNTDQTDFPVLISGVYSFLASTNNGGFVQNANGYDIVFSPDPEGATQLDHEIDRYDSTTGTSAFWVRPRTLSHTVDTVIYLFTETRASPRRKKTNRASGRTAMPPCITWEMEVRSRGLIQPGSIIVSRQSTLAQRRG